jgi:DNA-binding NarL/FixJ family response regulator
MSGQEVRVVVADRYEVFREGLKSVIDSIEWLSLVGEAEDIESLTGVLQSVECELVLADVSLVGVDRQSIVLKLRRAVPDIGVVLVAGEDDLGRLSEALVLGADGFVRRDASVPDFVAALENVAHGYHYIQPELVRPLVSGSNGGHGRLTFRQIGVLQGVADGMSNKQIGHDLGVSETTVKTDLRVVFAEFGVTGRAEAVAVAMRVGIVD